MFTATTRHIEDLRRAAGAHGDIEQAETCDKALAGDARAWRECELVIDAARALTPRWRIVSRAGIEYGIYAGETAGKTFEELVREALRDY